MANHSGNDVAQTIANMRERFDSSTDFTIGIEEEFAICDPQSLDLVPEFERLRDAAEAASLGERCAGELLAAEVEFFTDKADSWQAAVERLIDLRRSVAELFRSEGLVAGATGTHPWADYREQEKVDLTYYAELVDRLQYVAHRNNTFGLHVHIGVRGADRAIRVSNAMRNVQPMLLALSCSSPFLDGRDCGLASARSVTFSRIFPRGNVAPSFASIDDYTNYLQLLLETGTIFRPNQVWWGVRPHPTHGTVELRMFDAQPDVRDTAALAALGMGAVAWLCELHDAGELPEPVAAHLVDENLWRAARYGTDADFIDVEHRAVVNGNAAITQLIENARGASRRAGLELEPGLDAAQRLLDRGCSAFRQRELAQAGDLKVAYDWVVDTTMAPEATGVLG
jgi:carboxylate-amine ligase